jgi:ADP-ribose pyrophosphatase
VPLDVAVEHVLAGRLAAPITALGVLAAYAARQGGWQSLRPVTSPWQGLATVEAMGRRRSASEA